MTFYRPVVNVYISEGVCANDSSLYLWESGRFDHLQDYPWVRLVDATAEGEGACPPWSCLEPVTNCIVTSLG